MSQDDTPQFDIDTFQQSLKLQFNDSDLLNQALTHSSYINEHENEDLEDNERLEFLGDAILDYLTADMIFRRFPTMREGEMTRLRAALVRTESLAQLAVESRIGDALYIGKGEAASGGRERENTLCAAFEAFIGALYLDQGLDAVRDFVIPRLSELQKDVMEDAIRKDHRSQFQEWAQAVYSITPEYHVIGAEGPEHEKQFIVGAYLNETKVAEGRGKSKRSGAQDAARHALELKAKNALPFTPPPSPQGDSDQSE